MTEPEPDFRASDATRWFLKNTPTSLAMAHTAIGISPVASTLLASVLASIDEAPPFPVIANKLLVRRGGQR